MPGSIWWLGESILASPSAKIFSKSHLKVVQPQISIRIKLLLPNLSEPPPKFLKQWGLVINKILILSKINLNFKLKILGNQWVASHQAQYLTLERDTRCIPLQGDESPPQLQIKALLNAWGQHERINSLTRFLHLKDLNFLDLSFLEDYWAKMRASLGISNIEYHKSLPSSDDTLTSKSTRVVINDIFWLFLDFGILNYYWIDWLKNTQDLMHVYHNPLFLRL